MWSPLKTSTLIAGLAALVSPVMGVRLLRTNSLDICQADSKFTASQFNVIFTPDNGTATFDIAATSTIQGKVVFDVAAYAYGYNFFSQVIDPCNLKTHGLCPMAAGRIPFTFIIPVGKDAVGRVPSIAYGIPDLDAKVRVYVNLTETGESVACLEATVTNGKTVDLVGVKWATAVIAGLALVSSAVISGVGHPNAAAHVAANSLSLFGYFQSIAIVGLTAVQLPPIVQGWTQDFQWSMGIIKVNFMQDIFTWYLRATGGTPSTLLDSVATGLVRVQKRSLELASEHGMGLAKKAWAMMPRHVVDVASSLAKRTDIKVNGAYVVFGIQRVGVKAEIMSTNIFLTVLVFFCLFALLTTLFVLAFKGFLDLAAKQGWIKSDKFMEFRNGWKTILKGILFRVGLIGFPQICIFSLWEFTQRDSTAEVVLAVFFLIGLIVTLGWGATKVILIARRSVAMHRNPAYILFSDPQALNKWGFLYIQFRASAYYFIVPMLGYLLLKAMFVGLGQRSAVTQAVAFVVLEAGALIAASVFRPWMDKSTNSFNIAICVINFLNAIFLLIFSDVFDAPGLVIGVVGVVLFVLNAVFALVLLIMVIVSTTLTLIRKNPDARYQVMGDDRASFMKSQTQVNMTTELDALAATARGDKGGYKGLDLDDDNESFVSGQHRGGDGRGSYISAAQSQTSLQNPPRSPVNPTMPLFPAGQRRPESPFRSASPNPYNRSGNGSVAGQNRQQGNASPWQRGAGYEN